LEKNNRKIAWISITIVLFGAGLFIIIQDGFVRMQNAIIENPQVVETTVNGQPMLSSHEPFDQRVYDFPQRVEKNGFVRNISVQVDAVPTLLCAGDNVAFVTVSGAIGISTDVKQIYVLFIDSHKQVQQSYNLTEAENEITNSILSDTPVVELNPKTNDSYEYEPVMLGTQKIHLLETGGLPPFSFSNVGDKIVQVLVIHSSNSKVESKLDTQTIFTISPSSACLQVTTERETLKQIRLQNITDADIVGLSWIAIGVGLVIMGFDIILRIYLDPYADDMKKQKTSTKTEPWNCDFFPDRKKND
jgi:hypothetical protein